MHSPTVVLAAALCVSYILYSLYLRYQASRWLKKIPIHEFEDDNSWQRYQEDYKSLIRSGYDKYSRNDQIFRTKNPDGGWRIIISLDHLRQIKHASNKTLSWQKQIQEILMMVCTSDKLPWMPILTTQKSHTGAPDRPPWSAKTIRVELNRRIDNLTDYMVAQINDSFLRLLPDSETGFEEVNILQLFRQAVAQITTRIFSSEELAQDQEWNNVSDSFSFTFSSSWSDFSNPSL